MEDSCRLLIVAICLFWFFPGLTAERGVSPLPVFIGICVTSRAESRRDIWRTICPPPPCIPASKRQHTGRFAHKHTLESSVIAKLQREAVLRDGLPSTPLPFPDTPGLHTKNHFPSKAPLTCRGKITIHFPPCGCLSALLSYLLTHEAPKKSEINKQNKACCAAPAEGDRVF